LLANADATNASTLRDRWTALDAVDDPVAAKRLDDAFSQVVDAATDAEARSQLERLMADNAEHRLNLCLHLEISAGAESPKELQQQRMELQVSRLRDSMGGRIGDNAETDPLADASTLLRDWYLCVPAAAVDGLDARFARAKQALTGAERTAAAVNT
jgi:hypothetical protein